MRTYRFQDGRGEALEVNAKGVVVTSRLEPLGVYTPKVTTRVELAATAGEAEAVVEQIIGAHRAEGFGPLDAAALAAAQAAIEPFASWQRLGPETFAAHFGYLGAGAGLDELARRVRSVDVAEQRVELEGGGALTFSLPRADDDLADPEPLRSYWARHASSGSSTTASRSCSAATSGRPSPTRRCAASRPARRSGS